MAMASTSRKRPRESDEIILSDDDEVKLASLFEMFPEKSMKYLKSKILTGGGNLAATIDHILNNPEEDSEGDGDSGVSMNESELMKNASLSSTILEMNDSRLDNPAIILGDEDPTAAGPGPSSAKSTSNNYIETNYATLLSVFPEVSPIFLQENAWNIGNDPNKLQEFITMNLERKSSLPSRKDYEKNENKALTEKKIKMLIPQDFLDEFDDPISHYMDLSRKVSEKYKEEAIYYLKKHFPAVHHSTMKKIMDENHTLLYPCLKALESKVKDIKGKKGKSPNRRSLKKPSFKDLDFLKEYIFIKLESKIQYIKDSKAKKKAAAIDEARKVGGLFECQVCFDDECLVAEVVFCDNGHMVCPACVRRGAEVQIGENKVPITCPLACGAELPLDTLRAALPPRVFAKVMEKKQLEEIRAAGIEDLVQCPACNYAVIVPEDAQDRVLTCGNTDCGRQTCRLCGEESHIPLSCDEVEKDSEVKARTKVENAMTEAMLRECPKCKNKFFKEEGCNKMTCTCGQAMCYLCRQPVSNDYRHFYGQGGTPRKGLCPLWSNVSKLHTDEVTDAAKKAKKDLEGQLKNDPSKDIKKPKDYDVPPNVFENAAFEESDSDDDRDESDDDEFSDDDDIIFLDDEDVDDDGFGYFEDGDDGYRPMDW